MSKRIVFLLLVSFFFISPVLAQETSIISNQSYALVSGISDVCLKNGECTLCDILLVGIRLTRFLLGLSGAVALLLLVIAGLYLLLSGGSQELIGKAKTIIKNLIWGFVFVFLSWQIINLVLLVFLKPNNSLFTKGNAVATVSGQIWSEITCTGWTKKTYTTTPAEPANN